MELGVDRPVVLVKVEEEEEGEGESPTLPIAPLMGDVGRTMVGTAPVVVGPVGVDGDDVPPPSDPGIDNVPGLALTAVMAVLVVLCENPDEQEDEPDEGDDPEDVTLKSVNVGEEGKALLLLVVVVVVVVVRVEGAVLLMEAESAVGARGVEYVILTDRNDASKGLTSCCNLPDWLLAFGAWKAKGAAWLLI
ncbi:uncharacterized protein EI90DRAFT_3012092 [Cantharellus anzutake]|uniref:uncharacterized protein n=1 Tax=Cantharellus anzutake TaxID=1750568 RepID=UPI001907CC1C|nr:uncharacterized protein EI90DRAFT_3012092 [Cantharellus anzutake]KAF8341548.1 hypothetical protein EI90DRAFT_3012092 [Cantharellus anzutake]